MVVRSNIKPEAAIFIITDAGDDDGVDDGVGVAVAAVTVTVTLATTGGSSGVWSLFINSTEKV